MTLMRLQSGLAFLVAIFMSCAGAVAESTPLLRVTLKKQTIEGKSLAHDDYGCWLATCNGRTTWVDFSDVKTFATVAEKFESDSKADTRDRLRREFGREYEVAAAGEYVVVARHGQARQYAALFDDVYRSFVGYFGQRGFTVDRPEFPLVAIVFRTRAEFTEYCQAEGLRRTDGFVGFYFGRANCVVLYDEQANVANVDERRHASPSVVGQLFENAGHSTIAELTGFGDGLGAGRIGGNLRDTIVHEGIHQVGYNTGLHSRIGPNPKWVVEGLATLFEPEGVRSRQTRGGLRERTNVGQYIAFMRYRQRGRMGSDSLESLITRDERFLKQVGPAYAESWALTFFLTETRRPDYARYLKSIVARDPMVPYTAGERLKDFQTAFGTDLDRVDEKFLRFMDDVEESIERRR